MRRRPKIARPSDPPRQPTRRHITSRLPLPVGIPLSATPRDRRCADTSVTAPPAASPINTQGLSPPSSGGRCPPKRGHTVKPIAYPDPFPPTTVIGLHLQNPPICRTVRGGTPAPPLCGAATHGPPPADHIRPTVRGSRTGAARGSRRFLGWESLAPEIAPRATPWDRKRRLPQLVSLSVPLSPPPTRVAPSLGLLGDILKLA